MITEYGVRRAIRVLTEAGFRIPKDIDLDAMAKRWIDVIDSLTDDDMEAAAAEYVRRDHPAYAWPTPGQLVECARHLRNNDTAGHYREPDYDDPPADPSFIRKAWEAEGIDFDDLRRAHRAMRARRGETGGGAA